MPRTLSEQEYNDVLQQVMASAPPNMDEATFNRWIGPQVDAAVAQAELQSPSPQGSAMGRFASNFGAMVNPIEMAKGLYNAVTPQAVGDAIGIPSAGPIGTVRAIGGAMGNQWSQGIDLAKQGRYTEGIGHIAAGSLPILGPTAANIGEQIAQGDKWGGAGAMAGLLAPFAVKPALQGARSLSPKGLRATIAEQLEAKAAGKYADVMAPKVGRNKTRFGTMADQVAPELSQNPEMGAFSREGLHTKVKAALDNATAKLDEATDASLATQSIDTQPILKALQEARTKLVAEAIDADRTIPSLEGKGGRPTPSGLTRNIGSGQMQKAPIKKGRPLGRNVEPAPNAPRIAAIDQVIQEVRQLGPLARYESLRRIRQAWDSVAKQVYMPSPTADLLALKGNSLGAADATSALRENLAQASPKMAEANQAYHLYKTADDVLAATKEVERTRPKVGRAIVARLTGAVTGGEVAGAKGAVAGYVLGPIVDAAAAGAPTLRLQTAQLMTRLAKAVRAGDVEQVNSIMSRLKRLAPAATTGVAKQTAPEVYLSISNRERPEERPTATGPR